MILITSPVYGNGDKNVLNKTKLVTQLKNIAHKNHIPYLNYTDSLVYKNPLYYADYFHLNRQGATIFSKSISLAFDNISAINPLFNK